MSKPQIKKSRERGKASPKKQTVNASPAATPSSLWWRITKWSLVLCIWGGVALAGVLAWFVWNLPALDALGPTVDKTRRPSVTIVASDGSLVADYGDLYGARLTVNELPPQLVQAVVAIEDRRFFEHSGVDLRGIARAAVANLRAGGIVQGGSTLTQQLAKNLFLTPERSFDRKIRELILALSLERRFGKDELLTIYLNRVYLGAGTYGVEAAAQRYFGASARDVDTYQAALLAGLLRAPSRLNPNNSEAAAHRRACTVLEAMANAGFLTSDEAAKLSLTRWPGRGDEAPPRLPEASAAQRYFADWTLERAAGYSGTKDADLAVETTLDPKLQARAEAAISRANTKGAQVALVAMRSDGAVLAMVGGRSYAESQFNRVTRAERQPGSAFKPIVYLPAVESGMTPDSRVLDLPITVDGWTPQNFSRGFRGEVTLREAVARSLNTVAVRVSEDIGRGQVIQSARRLGITSPLTLHPSLALGAGEVTPLELTAAYAVFANSGFAVVPYGVTEIRQAGEVLFRRPARPPRRVIEADAAVHMTEMLRAVVEWGTGKTAKIERPAAGKSGTSQDFRDAWFVGFSGDLVVTVWVGNDDNSPTAEITGSSIPAAIWKDFMSTPLAASVERPVRLVNPAD